MENLTDEHHQATQSGPQPSATGGPLLNLTERAIEKVKTFAQASQEAIGKHLRIYVQGGGCSGFEYGFNLDEQREDDQVVEISGIKVLLDPISLPYLQKSTVDWVEDFRGSGFSVQNPNATGSCGCGHSFST